MGLAHWLVVVAVAIFVGAADIRVHSSCEDRAAAAGGALGAAASACAAGECSDACAAARASAWRKVTYLNAVDGSACGEEGITCSKGGLLGVLGMSAPCAEVAGDALAKHTEACGAAPNLYFTSAVLGDYFALMPSFQAKAE